MVRISWIDPHRLVIRVSCTGGVTECAAAISRNLQRHTHEIDAIRIGGIDADLSHVPWIRETSPHFLPASAPIVRSINARFSVSLRGAVPGHLGLDRGIDDVRTRPAHIESDSSDVDLRQSLCESRPRIAGIDALPDSA